MGRETMTDIKPVAYMDKDGTLINETTHPEFYTHLFTADALRAAQVQVLREAAKKLEINDEGYAEYMVRCIADELERSGK